MVAVICDDIGVRGELRISTKLCAGWIRSSRSIYYASYNVRN